jgi:hypothetical protein
MAEVEISTGSKLKIGSLYVARLTKIDPPEMSKEEVDVTTLDSTGGYREFLPGLRDGGSLSLEGYVVLGDTGQDGLKDNYDGDVLESFTVELSNGETCTFDGYVSRYRRGSAAVNEAIKFTAEVRCSGPVDYGSTDSANASALVVTQVGGTALTALAFAPTFAGGTYNYTVTFTTQTSYATKITFVAAHTIKLYVDDEYVEDLTSGTESSAIDAAAVGAKKLTIKAWEADKSPIYYNLMVNRLS